MVSKAIILSIVYHEPEWQETKKCIEMLNVPVVYVERNPKGVGSLAEAINRGVREISEIGEFEYIWIVTNVTFTPRVLKEMIDYMDLYPDTPGIHPCFDSDHEHLRQKVNTEGSHEFITYVPFIEFTAALVRVNVFKSLPLNENLPFVGHDMAWGYEIRQLGMMPAVYHGEKLGHTYIRHSKSVSPYTRKRKRLRAQAVKGTIKELIRLYGTDYKDKIQYHNAL